MNTNFYSLWFDPTGVKPKSTVSVADALFAQSLIGLIEEVRILGIILRFARPFAVILLLIAKTFGPFNFAFVKANIVALRLGISQI